MAKKSTAQKLRAKFINDRDLAMRNARAHVGAGHRPDVRDIEEGQAMKSLVLLSALALLPGCSTLGAVGLAMITDKSVTATHQPHYACGNWWLVPSSRKAQAVANLEAACRRVSF